MEVGSYGNCCSIHTLSSQSSFTAILLGFRSYRFKNFDTDNKIIIHFPLHNGEFDLTFNPLSAFRLNVTYPMNNAGRMDVLQIREEIKTVLIIRLIIRYH